MCVRECVSAVQHQCNTSDVPMSRLVAIGFVLF